MSADFVQYAYTVCIYSMHTPDKALTSNVTEKFMIYVDVSSYDNWFWLQDICMPAIRSQASAVYIAVITLIGGQGPLVV